MDTTTPPSTLTQAKLDEIYSLLVASSAKVSPPPGLITFVVHWTVPHALVPLPPARVPRKLQARIRRGLRRRSPRTHFQHPLPGLPLSDCKVHT